MIESAIVRIFLILLASGSVGSLIALVPVLLGKQQGETSYGTAAGVGFLIGASLGGLFGIFAVLLDQI